MQIGEVIRKYRKDKNLTQEEMANRLGVTAPAVNKWENGNSYPDILLLAPIARLLGITLDTLMAFKEDLTDEEVARYIEEISGRFRKKEPYDQVFTWAREAMELYPNCENLNWQLAAILDAKRLTDHIPDSGQYEEYLKMCYVRLLESRDEDIRRKAANSLFVYYLRKEEYETAEKYLSYCSDQDPDKKRKQALILSRTGRKEEACRTYEEMLYSGYQMINLVLYNLFTLAMEDGETERAHMLVEKQQELGRLFEMGKYYEASSGLDLAMQEKDVEKTLELMENMISSIDRIYDFCKSPLFTHMSFRQPDGEGKAMIKPELVKCFRDEALFGYMKDEERWKNFIHRLG